MKPDVPAVLADLSARLVGEIAPNVQPSYLAGWAAMSAGLIAMVAEEFDRAASRRVEENRAIRALFARAAALDLPGELAGRLQALASSADDDLHVSALEAGNAALRAALIDLHAAVEGLEAPEAKALNAAIWAELAASTERRKVESANF